ncbi:MAG: sugar transferase [Pseudomonadota bacterium]
MGPSAPASNLYASFFKRVLDVALVVLSAPLTLPLVLLFGLLIRRDGGPMFYSQLRVGKDGKLFRCWKLRSMVANAEERLAEYLRDNPEANAEWTVHQKLKDDPRITRIGHFIRCSSIDELPQLWNVLRGDMSIVGPRPFMPEQQKLYKGNAYYAMRPGLTGYWQVSQRSESSFAARAAFDNSYANDLTLLTDVKVVAQTVGVVLRATGR